MHSSFQIFRLFGIFLCLQFLYACSGPQTGQYLVKKLNETIIAEKSISEGNYAPGPASYEKALQKYREHNDDAGCSKRPTLWPGISKKPKSTSL